MLDSKTGELLLLRVPDYSLASCRYRLTSVHDLHTLYVFTCQPSRHIPCVNRRLCNVPTCMCENTNEPVVSNNMNMLL